ncbi:hypothetical protein [Planctomicrobium sp. SH664]|uniref:hypothetical protein n=1 Tax=Planctomicrobium sp. SH664 TaxID=3448125 RepID=UPI003F5B695D
MEPSSSPWLCIADLVPLSPLQVTIAKLEIVKDGTHSRGHAVAALSFEGMSKRLVLNAANSDLLRRKYGATLTQLAGQAVILAVEPLKRPIGQQTHCIRIK